MKIGVCGLFLILLLAVRYGQTQDLCSLKSNAKSKPFPDLFNMTPAAYQMAVDFTVVNEMITDYFVEYYDKDENKGRIDRMHDEDMKRYYYYSDGMEAFEISELKFTCTERNESSVPDFMELGQYDWYYNYGKQMVHGPSAMFKIAFEEYRRSPSKVVYMGESEDVRGIKAQYWRRCLRKNVTAHYFFSDEVREGVYGIKNLTLIPLRIQIFGIDDEFPDASREILPQNYEVMTFAPFLDDPWYTFELPVGMGCGRKPREDDTELPSFGKQSLYIQAEVIYVDYNEGSATSYSSDFTFTYDIDSKYLSYFYTPWKTVDGVVQGGFPVYVVFDTENKYVFNTSYQDGTCTVGSVGVFVPQYTLPRGNQGYISLSDPSIFYPNNEFSYLGEGMDRGYRVDIFEAPYRDSYPLGDRSVSNAVVTHYYLKADEFKVGPRAVEEALTRIRIGFNGTTTEGKKMNSVLNFNFFSFSTGIAQRNSDFYIAQCFRDDGEIIFITIGFTAEDGELELITEDIPSVVENAKEFIKEITDLPPARLPHVLVDIQESLYVTFILVERPPFQLDFEQPEANKYISGAKETKGITLLQDCANMCLESDYDCWGFAHCGATCYVGAGDKSTSKIVKKKNCQYYKRTNFNTVPSLKKIRRDLEHAVQRKQPELTVAKKGGGTVDFKPSYIGDPDFGESREIFDLMGMETSPRLSVVKDGYKLTAETGENIGRNFGSFTYGECQLLCLDFKACETVSYCLSTNECIVSRTRGEDIGETKFVEDSFCIVVTRKNSDAFIRTPGDVLSQTAKKVVNTTNEEECAKACVKETSFNCLSFDSCRTKDGKNSCRLHAVHILDLKDQEGAVSKEAMCGHYSKKYTYDFKRQPKRKAVGSGFVMSTEVNVEQCAKYCVEYNQGQCNGFDSCQGKDTVGSCTILTQELSQMKTASDDMCDHFEIATRRFPRNIIEDRPISKGLAGGIGFLLFVIGCVIGGLIVYGIAYYRVNRRQ